MADIGGLVMALPALTPLQWFALVHPVLIILFVYPVVGATIRLGILARERRLQINPIAPTVPIEHADHGRWVAGALVLAVLLAFSPEVAAAWMEQPLDPAEVPARLLALVAATGCTWRWSSEPQEIQSLRAVLERLSRHNDLGDRPINFMVVAGPYAAAAAQERGFCKPDNCHFFAHIHTFLLLRILHILQ